MKTPSPSPPIILTSLNIPPIIENVPKNLPPNNNNLRRRHTTTTTTTPRGNGKFTITYKYETDIPTQLLTMLTIAADRWGKIIITKHIPLNGLGTRSVCGQQRTIPDFNDILVFVSVKVDDGTGGTLASATPCLGFEDFSRIGEMNLDKDDVAVFLRNHPDVLLNVIIHELGHILGIGTMWDTFSLVGGTKVDPIYVGQYGNNALNYVNNTSGIPNIKIETLGGTGTALAHWREQTYGDELMTGFLGLGEQPLSLISIQSLIDLKYHVDISAADLYTIPINGWNASQAFVDLSPQNTPTVSKNDFTLPPGFSGIAHAADTGILWIAIVGAVGGLVLILIGMSFLRKRKTHMSNMYIGGSIRNSSGGGGGGGSIKYQPDNSPQVPFNYAAHVVQQQDVSIIADANKEWCCPKCTLTTVGPRCEACDCPKPIVISPEKSLLLIGVI